MWKWTYWEFWTIFFYFGDPGHLTSVRPLQKCNLHTTMSSKNAGAVWPQPSSHHDIPHRHRAIFYHNFGISKPTVYRIANLLFKDRFSKVNCVNNTIDCVVKGHRKNHADRWVEDSYLLHVDPYLYDTKVQSWNFTTVVKIDKYINRGLMSLWWWPTRIFHIFWRFNFNAVSGYAFNVSFKVR